jgi:hypothetical protein
MLFQLSHPLVERAHRSLNQPMASIRALRGIMALDAGDTSKAALHFRKALEIAGPDGIFSDRPIAQRYGELLSRKWAE